MEEQLASVRRAHLALMERTANTLDRFVGPLDRGTATTLRDGGDGWTITEVLGHLRDFDGFFRGRAIMMVEQDTPRLPAYGHEAIAIAARYNEQDPHAVVAELLRSRRETHAFFSGLTDEQWGRAGIHPERGHFTMTDAVIQVGHHDTVHLEQIAKILLRAANIGVSHSRERPKIGADGPFAFAAPGCDTLPHGRRGAAGQHASGGGGDGRGRVGG
jgi:hypothetical protein